MTQVKTIRIGNEEKEMTFEEVLAQFTPAIHKEINSQKANFNRAGEETDDMFQNGTIWLWKAYSSYDISKETQFYTYAYTYIKRGVQDITMTNNAQKRNNFQAVSFDASLTSDDDDFSLQSVLKYEDDFTGELIAENIVKDSMKLMSEAEKQAFPYMLKEIPAARLAKDLGVSKQCMAARYRDIKAKIKTVAMEYGYSL